MPNYSHYSIHTKSDFKMQMSKTSGNLEHKVSLLTGIIFIEHSNTFETQSFAS